MGLFDRLFGKKKKEESQEELQAQLQAEEIAKEISETEKSGEAVQVIENVEEPRDAEPEIKVQQSEGDIPTVRVEDIVEKSDIEEEATPQETEKLDVSQPVEEVVEEEPVTEEPVVAEEVVPLKNEKEVEEKYEKSLKKTSRSFGDRLNALMANFRGVDEEFFEDVEEALILSDVGYELSLEIAEELREEVRLKNPRKRQDVKNVIIEKLADTLDDNGLNHTLNLQDDGLSVFIFVGVNGVGKTTTIGKLANRYRLEGKKVLLAAADTFRAGATDQLVEWGRRSQVPVVVGREGGDPASVVFDAVKKAKDEDYDVLLIDTAGRLQNKDHLMKELEKIIRIIKRELPDAPHETLLAVDATTGQNATQQAKQFSEVAPLTGIILTKLDGSAKGGIVFAIENTLKIPVKLVGLGEGLDDLEDFSPENFVVGVFSSLI
ncbi:signal recognition particle-docking protein FtsY [Floricoccus tropicus]|uniref:Signal recognition particle receptor FtsY n=1 Tax=Floricoccus tropicus TaxID=1859473 RepID=A0A1E8GK96_9LACT|nr:signal recognition particle-docking protein FtsY [Floricoccus tropicus]OFI48669.1 signal recognition particle-docking protein FtsY [Floricoccus tropicus]